MRPPILRFTTLICAACLCATGCDGLEQLQDSLDMSVVDARPDRRPPPRQDAMRSSNCPPGQEMSGELCNGKDDDCDGIVDEGFTNCQDPTACADGATRACSNECGSGMQECVVDEWSDCTVNMPNAEACNNADDDCDGEVDENLTCDMTDGSMDATVGDGGHDASADAGIDASGDAGLPPDRGPPQPACRQHLDCENGQYCLRQNCIAGLPGTYVFTMLSARFDGDEISDPFLAGDPDVFAVLSINDMVAGETERVEGADNVQWNQRLEVELRRDDNIKICVFDDDNFLGGGDDEIGCVRFLAENVVDIIRRFRGNRPANQTMWALVVPPPERNSHLEELRFSVERLIRQ